MVRAGNTLPIVGKDTGGTDIDISVQCFGLFPAGQCYQAIAFDVIMELITNDIGRMDNGFHPFAHPSNVGWVG